MRVVRRQSVSIACIGLGTTTLGGCAGDRSVMDPAAPEANDVASLGWALYAAATAVTVLVVALLLFGLVRRRRSTASDDSGALRWVLGGGVVLPVVVILPLIAFSVSIIAEPEGATMEIDVIGHQYWWEYRYRGHDAVTANELHIPVGEPVRLRMRSDDVIHAFWIPRLGGKRDLVPGHETTMVLEADEPGVYPGQCAEYCGIQHAKMRILVIAQERPEFERWVNEQRAPAVGATGSLGATLFSSQGCAACHTIRGTDAEGRLGPDLTHVASRSTLGAAVIENTPENLRRWIDETWEVKDEIVMPELPLTDEEVDAIAAYLETLE